MDYTQRQFIRDTVKRGSDPVNLEGLAKEHGTPLLIFDSAKMKAQYKRLQRSMPNVQFYFALKAAGHAEAVRAIQACDGYLDVATMGEINLVKKSGFPIERCMHTHPIKKQQEILDAYTSGLRRFVVENKSELLKFASLPSDIELLIRLSFPNPNAGSNLSYKFGATEEDAKELVRLAKRQGTTVAGFCLHVGSQIDRADAYEEAIHKTVQIMDDLEEELGIRFTILDIGGGFPVEYRQHMPSLEEIAAKVRPLIEPLMKRFTILAEPGRFVVAPSTLLITSVVGTNQRYDKPWYYIDDGLYGAYSICIYDGMQPHLFAVKELHTEIPASQFQPSVVAGPTCDSIDIVAKDYPLPELQVGDLLISPMMGAYSGASATTFNGIPVVKLITLPDQPSATVSEIEVTPELTYQGVRV